MSKIGFIGCGNMGGTLACAAAKSPHEIFTADHNEAKAKALAQKIGAVFTSNEWIAENCDMVFLGVKPQILSFVLGSLSEILANRKSRFVLVSMAAGQVIKSIGEMVEGDYPIIRIMPNTPAAEENGMILYCCNKNVTANDIGLFLEVMKSAGACDEISEGLIDAGSAVAGCGPAFVYMFIEALADGGVKCGLPREKALKYAAETVLGAAKMVKETGIHPAELKDNVCSPAGSTIEGVRALEGRNFRGACIEAVTASFERTKELGKK